MSLESCAEVRESDEGRGWRTRLELDEGTLAGDWPPDRAPRTHATGAAAAAAEYLVTNSTTDLGPPSLPVNRSSFVRLGGGNEPYRT